MRWRYPWTDETGTTHYLTDRRRAQRFIVLDQLHHGSTLLTQPRVTVWQPDPR